MLLEYAIQVLKYQRYLKQPKIPLLLNWSQQIEI